MISAITQGIKITVETAYQERLSNPNNQYHLFSYHISIENGSDFEIQLLRRQWFIFDSDGLHREVEGEGVVGEQPIISAGGIYSYSSACNLRTDIGEMYGRYLMYRPMDDAEFMVDIPKFQMIVPQRLN